MSADVEQRKLAAIMFTDMVGYTALARRDEVLAPSPVPQGRQRIARRFIAGLNGRRGRDPPGRKEIVLRGRIAYLLGHVFGRPSGTLSVFRRDPGLAPWAIIYRPAGA